MTTLVCGCLVCARWKRYSRLLLEALDERVGVDVRDVGGDTGGVADIVEGELSDVGVLLEEEREGLADTTWGKSQWAVVKAL